MKKVVTEEMLEELVQDIEADNGLHIGLVFNNWRARHRISGISIGEVSYLWNK